MAIIGSNALLPSHCLKIDGQHQRDPIVAGVPEEPLPQHITCQGELTELSSWVLMPGVSLEDQCGPGPSELGLGKISST